MSRVVVKRAFKTRDSLLSVEMENYDGFSSSTMSLHLFLLHHILLLLVILSLQVFYHPHPRICLSPSHNQCYHNPMPFLPLLCLDDKQLSSYFQSLLPGHWRSNMCRCRCWIFHCGWLNWVNAWVSERMRMKEREREQIDCTLLPLTKQGGNAT